MSNTQKYQAEVESRIRQTVVFEIDMEDYAAWLAESNGGDMNDYIQEQLSTGAITLPSFDSADTEYIDSDVSRFDPVAPKRNQVTP